MRRIGAAIAVVALLFVLSSLGGLVVDWAWFASIGYARVFWTALLAKAAVFGVVFAVSAALLWLNANLALRFASIRRPACRRRFRRASGPLRPRWGNRSGFSRRGSR